MTVVTLREILLKQRVAGKRPAVVVLSVPDFTELLSDLTIKFDAFDPIMVHGVLVVTADQILHPGHEFIPS